MREPVFIAASLVGESARQKSFSSNFKSFENFEIVESVDGRGWTDQYADTLTTVEVKKIRDKERLKGKLWFGPPAVACAITHRDKLLPHAESRDAIICEDDVIIDRDFIELWQDGGIRDSIRCIDGVVLIYYSSKNPISSAGDPVASFGRFKIYRVSTHNIVSAVCYYANREVSMAIRNYQRPISCSADNWEKMVLDGVFRSIYVVDPSPCTLGGFSSNIGYSLNSWARWNFLPIRIIRKIRRKLHKNIYDSVEVVDE